MLFKSFPLASLNQKKPLLFFLKRKEIAALFWFLFSLFFLGFELSPQVHICMQYAKAHTRIHVHIRVYPCTYQHAKAHTRINGHIRVYTCTSAYKESMHIRVYTYTLPGYKNCVGNCAELKRFLHIRVYTWTYAYSRSHTRIHVHIRVCARTRIMSPDLWGRWEVRRTREASRPSAFCLYSIRLFYHVCVCVCVCAYKNTLESSFSTGQPSAWEEEDEAELVCIQ